VRCSAYRHRPLDSATSGVMNPAEYSASCPSLGLDDPVVLTYALRPIEGTHSMVGFVLELAPGQGQCRGPKG